MIGARDSDLSGFHRLSENFEAVAAEFWKFVEKKHAAVCKGNLPRARLAATTDQRCSASTVVWIAKWPLEDNGLTVARVVNIAQCQAK